MPLGFLNTLLTFIGFGRTGLIINDDKKVLLYYIPVPSLFDEPPREITEDVRVRLYFIFQKYTPWKMVAVVFAYKPFEVIFEQLIKELCLESLLFFVHLSLHCISSSDYFGPASTVSHRIVKSHS